MREVTVAKIEEAVSRLCVEANIYLGSDIEARLRDMRDKEIQNQPKAILDELLENAKVARTEGLPICQDTGMAVIHVELGQEVHLVGGDITAAINRGVSKGYQQGYLRASVVEDPILRKNTGDNTPAVIIWDMVPGDAIKITVAPKGFGSENMSSLTMLSPSQGVQGIKDAVIHTVKKAGPNPCPPIILGIGIGGTMDMAAKLAKLALLRPLGVSSTLPHIAQLEVDLLEEINHLNIGPGGLGGITTALAVNINTYPTHIAGLPVAVNMSCHATRHKSVTL